MIDPRRSAAERDRANWLPYPFLPPFARAARAATRTRRTAYPRGVSIVKINAITVPRERFGEFERRFASRAGRVSSADGFEAFELLRPNDDREVCLVITRW